MFQFLLDHKTEVVSLVYCIICEAMALNPRLKSNSPLDLLKRALKSSGAELPEG